MADRDHTRRRVVKLTFATALSLGVGGCLSESTPGTTTTAPGAATERETGTTTFNQTYPTDVGTGDDPVDVRVSNGTDETRRFRVRITDESSGAAVFDDTFSLRPERQRYLDLFEHRASGVYLVEASTDSADSATYEWNLDERPASGRLSVWMDDDGIQFGYRIA
ncbi:hypothetical protein [Haloarchaeobius sp. TZWSO28]|uniref:hypothetical protein n=1 Tax=Haloarchaeobius sp. TZWSO28 TaxID=3446119 RepID=UPI003EBB622A